MEVTEQHKKCRAGTGTGTEASIRDVRLLLHRHFFVLNNGAWLETAKEKEEASPPHWSSRCLAAVQRQLWVLQRQLWVLQRQR